MVFLYLESGTRATRPELSTSVAEAHADWPIPTVKVDGLGRVVRDDEYEMARTKDERESEDDGTDNLAVADYYRADVRSKARVRFGEFSHQRPKKSRNWADSPLPVHVFRQTGRNYLPERKYSPSEKDRLCEIFAVKAMAAINAGDHGGVIKIARNVRRTIHRRILDFLENGSEATSKIQVIDVDAVPLFVWVFSSILRRDGLVTDELPKELMAGSNDLTVYDPNPEPDPDADFDPDFDPDQKPEQTIAGFLKLIVPGSKRIKKPKPGAGGKKYDSAIRAWEHKKWLIEIKIRFGEAIPEEQRIGSRIGILPLAASGTPYTAHIARAGVAAHTMAELWCDRKNSWHFIEFLRTEISAYQTAYPEQCALLKKQFREVDGERKTSEDIQVYLDSHMYFFLDFLLESLQDCNRTGKFQKTKLQR